MYFYRFVRFYRGVNPMLIYVELGIMIVALIVIIVCKVAKKKGE